MKVKNKILKFLDSGIGVITIVTSIVGLIVVGAWHMERNMEASIWDLSRCYDVAKAHKEAKVLLTEYLKDNKLAHWEKDKIFDLQHTIRKEHIKNTIKQQLSPNNEE